MSLCLMLATVEIYTIICAYRIAENHVSDSNIHFRETVLALKEYSSRVLCPCISSHWYDLSSNASSPLNIFLCWSYRVYEVMRSGSPMIKIGHCLCLSILPVCFFSQPSSVDTYGVVLLAWLNVTWSNSSMLSYNIKYLIKRRAIWFQLLKWFYFILNTHISSKIMYYSMKA